MKLSDLLRKMIRKSGRSINSIARGSGVGQSTLQRFVVDGNGMSSDNMDKLALYCGLVDILSESVPREIGSMTVWIKGLKPLVLSRRRPVWKRCRYGAWHTVSKDDGTSIENCQHSFLP